MDNLYNIVVNLVTNIKWRIIVFHWRIESVKIIFTLFTCDVVDITVIPRHVTVSSDGVWECDLF